MLEQDPIRDARMALFNAGGLTLVTDSRRGWMVGDYPNAEPRAKLYNELADLHLKRRTLPREYRSRLKELLGG